jgi:hypothetical protein
MAKAEIPDARDADASHSLDDAIARQIAATVTSLKATLEEMQPLTKQQEDFLRSHHKAILMVIDLESQLEKRHAQLRVREANGLDLDSARTEILRRIARFKVTAPR